jgi:hypothetical protein
MEGGNFKMSPFNQFPAVSIQLISLESFSCFLVVCALFVSKSFREFLNRFCYQVASLIVRRNICTSCSFPFTLNLWSSPHIVRVSRSGKVRLVEHTIHTEKTRNHTKFSLEILKLGENLEDEL